MEQDFQITFDCSTLCHTGFSFDRCVKYALDFQSLSSSNEDGYAISMLSNQDHNKEELHLIHTAAICVVSLFQS